MFPESRHTIRIYSNFCSMHGRPQTSKFGYAVLGKVGKVPIRLTNC